MRVIRFLLVILIAGVVGYYLGTNHVNMAWKDYHPSVRILSKEPPGGTSQLDMSEFWTVFQAVEDKYYDKTALDQQKMLNGAISGMVNSIDDPYTVYLPPTQNNDFKQTMSGQFTGIGAELGLKDKQIIVVAPIDGSPAQKAGIKAGDAIVKVNRDSTLGWSVSQAVDKIRGPKGTSVLLSVLHKNEGSPKDIKIVRDTITVKSVTSWVKPVEDISSVTSPSKVKIDPTTGKAEPTATPASAPQLLGKGGKKVAYIRLSQFGDNTNQEWLSLSNSLALSIQKDKTIKGVVLDLRNNPGGYVTDAVFIASEFLPVGKTVVVQDFGGGHKEELTVKRSGLMLTVPLVVLINKGSASAAEIVAGSLRDYKRAILIGEDSFGKGTMQNADDLGNGAGLHVTIARWLTPNSTWVGNGKNGQGLKPDIVVTLDTKDPTHDTQLEKAVEELTK